MNQLVKEIEEIADATDNVGLTKKGAVTLLSSKDDFTDLFSMIGSVRGHANEAVTQFKRCYAKDSKLAVRIALWARDARGGAGERAVFRAIVDWLLLNGSKKDVLRLIDSGVIEEFGRWDDYLGIMTGAKVNAEVRQAAANRVLNAIRAGNGLAAKWMPRKGAVAAKVRKLFALSPKAYRRLIVDGTKVVETQMCAKAWEQIKYEHVPSVAMARYTRAFNRNSSVTFPAYKAALESGEVKAKAGVLFPYDVIRTVKNGDAAVADAQWRELPDFVEDGASMLPIIDVSGSMGTPVSGSVTAMDIAVSLGIYLAERNKGAFQDLFMTFETEPSIIKLEGKTIADRVCQVVDAPWGRSTNLQAAFDLLLSTAVKNNVPQEDMPKNIFIVSDMEFDQAMGVWSYGVKPKDTTNYETIARKYKAAGYDRPNVIFWNVVARKGNVQVEFNKAGTAMISGFSPSIVRPVLSAEEITPRGVMEMAVMVPRYDVDGLTR